MPAQTYEQIAKQIQSKQLAPIYLLHGEESYYIDKLCKLFEEDVLDQTQKEFDFAVYYGSDLKNKDFNVADIAASCQRYPMTSPYQLIIIKEAQYIAKWDGIDTYFKSPSATSVLVIAHKHKKMDKRKSTYLALNKTGMVFESQKLKDNQYADWISKYITAKKYSIKHSAVALLSEYLGSDLNIISNELDKLILSLGNNENEINENHIEAVIGINKEYNVFELQNAFCTRDVKRIWKIAAYLKKNLKENPIMLIIPVLYKHFCKVLLYHALGNKLAPSELAAKIGTHPYYLNQYKTCAQIYNYTQTVKLISILKEYDHKCKGINSALNDEELLDELIFRLLHCC